MGNEMPTLEPLQADKRSGTSKPACIKDWLEDKINLLSESDSPEDFLP